MPLSYKGLLEGPEILLALCRPPLDPQAFPCRPERDRQSGDTLRRRNDELARHGLRVGYVCEFQHADRRLDRGQLSLERCPGSGRSAPRGFAACRDLLEGRAASDWSFSAERTARL